MWTLIQAHGGSEAVTDRASLTERFAYTDFPHFIDVFGWMTGFLTTPDDFRFAAEAVARDLARQHIIYAEASISTSDFAKHGLRTQEIARAVRDGLDSVDGTAVTLIVDLVRDYGPETAHRTLSDVIEVADETGIRGITIGGSEQAFPPEPFAAAFRRARDHGLRLTAHAGEAAGPESVTAALDVLGVERIGHGVRAVENPELLDRLVAEQVPLEVCPTSNLRTGVVPDWEHHPLGQLLAAGVNVTISSDDPAMFHCSVASDLRTASRIWPSLVDVEQLTRAAVDASWLPPHDQQQLLQYVTEWWSSVPPPTPG